MTRLSLLSKILGLLLALIFCTVMIFHLRAAAKNTADILVPAVEWSLLFLLPVAFIWFPEFIGSATGFIGHGFVDAETPAVIIAFFGWIALLGIPVAVYFTRW